ncbi:MAG: hypothetical protein AAFZ15_14995 [Bacteroidota bacterium]
MHLTSFYKRLGYLTWLVMLAMAMMFYQERAFFMDAGFQLFNMINEQSIQIYHYRFITAVPQIIPYLLMKINAPLWALAMAFSMSYILFFLLVYHVLVQHLKNIELGWVLIFLFTLISLDTFYHMQSEFYLGLSLLILSFGIILHNTDLTSKWQFPALSALLFTVGFSHKLSLIFFIFLWLFFLLNKKELRHKRYYFLLVLFFAITAFKSVYFTNWYEAAKQVDFKNHFLEYFPNFHTLPSNMVFLKRCIFHYYMLPILLLSASIFYVSKKQWLKPVMIWAFTIGFILLYNISDTRAANRFYSEVSYLPVIIFATVPFLFDMVPVLIKKIKWLPFIFIGILILRLTTIVNNQQVFENNFNWIESQLNNSEKLNTNRFLLTKEKAPLDTILMEWGVPFTAMHLSAIEHPKNAKTLLIMPDFNWYENKIKENDLFFSPFHKVFKNEELNNEYYDLENGNYILIDN